MINSCDLRVSQELVCLIGFPFTAGSALIRDWVMSEPVCNLAGFVMTTLGNFYPSLTVIRRDVLKKFSSDQPSQNLLSQNSHVWLHRRI